MLEQPSTTNSVQRITVLGATGSIGVSTLDVIARHPNLYKVFALTANSRWEILLEQCLSYTPVFAVVRDSAAAQLLAQALHEKNSPTHVLCGDEALADVARHQDVDAVMAAIVGAAGLMPTLAAVRAGKKVLLANKEALVMAGGLFTQAVAEHGATLLPIDSEHNAIFQCLPNHNPTCMQQGLASNGVRKILLTASGGPFRTMPLEQLRDVSPEQACAHPNWSMGRKISVDSASMMNKGLELIEACWLFNATPDQIQVVIHPQSVIHSMVEYVDGSVLAQLGNPDMRTPIAHALAWPQRIESGVSSLDLIATAKLDFSAPDFVRFPCLALAVKAAALGGSAPIILNAANEIAVEAFLNARIRFDQLAIIIEYALSELAQTEPQNLDEVVAIDEAARHLAERRVTELERVLS